MADRNYDIDVKTRADASGAQQAAAAMQDLDKSTKAATESAKKQTKESDENIAKTKQLTSAKRSLKEAVQGLAMEFPILARAISIATNPIAGALLAVSAGITAFASGLQRLREIGRDESLLGPVTGELKSAERITRALQKATEDYAQSLKKSASNAVDYAGKITALQSKMDASIDKTEALASKQKELEIATVDAGVKAGLISEQAGAALKAGIGDRYEAQSYARAQNRNAALLAAKQKALGPALQERDRLKALAAATKGQLDKGEEADPGRVTDAEMELQRAAMRVESLRNDARKLANEAGYRSLDETWVPKSRGMAMALGGQMQQAYFIQEDIKDAELEYEMRKKLLRTERSRYFRVGTERSQMKLGLEAVNSRIGALDSFIGPDRPAWPTPRPGDAGISEMRAGMQSLADTRRLETTFTNETRGLSQALDGAIEALANGFGSMDSRVQAMERLLNDIARRNQSQTMNLRNP